MLGIKDFPWIVLGTNIVSQKPTDGVIELYRGESFNYEESPITPVGVEELKEGDPQHWLLATGQPCFATKSEALEYAEKAVSSGKYRGALVVEYNFAVVA